MRNRLADAASPYLYAHADDPVAWQPWEPATFTRARAEGKPLLLSVGYFSCHWCNVMQRESYTDDSTARVINDHFVPVLVDREVRPDLDLIYQSAVEILEDEVGWPLHVMLTPDGLPFGGGVYFPPGGSNRSPTFLDLVHGNVEAWGARREKLCRRGQDVMTRVGRSLDPPPADGSESGLGLPKTAGGTSAGPVPADLLPDALARLEAGFDPEHGGFGGPVGAPKLLHPATLDLLLRLAGRGLDSAAELLGRTLDAMANGAVFDQLGGGFHHYAADRRWRVPHFEKTLYDNAQLVAVFARAREVLDVSRYRDVAERTGDWLLTELRDPGGAFWCALSAESDGEEGDFYRWTAEEVRAAAGSDAEVAASHWGLEDDGDPSVPAVTSDVEDDEALVRARSALVEARSRRSRPPPDTKVITGWNGLAAAGLAVAGDLLGRAQWIDAAETALQFVLDSHRREGRLLRCSRVIDSGRTVWQPAFCDDHALVLRGCLVLHEITGEGRWLGEARWVADEAIARFRADRGGFYLTEESLDPPALRPMDLSDVDLPSANAVLAFELQRLAELLDVPRYRDHAEAALRLVGPRMADEPKEHAALLAAVDRLG